MPATTPPDKSLAALLELWFGFRAPVSRRAYLCSGVVLLLIKYLGDVSIFLASEREIWTPLEYLSPLWALRIPSLDTHALIGILGLWSLPFIWIGASMTARRARSAAISPLVAILFFVPGVNYLLILMLAIAPSVTGPNPPPRPSEDHFRGLLAAVVLGSLAGGLMLAAAFLVLSSPYSLGLFAGGPFTIGLVTALVYNQGTSRAQKATQGAVQLALLAGAGSLLLFGIEGALCIGMAYPLAAPLAAIGGLLGRSVARPRAFQTAHLLIFLALAPLLTALDRGDPEPALREILTSVEIDATPRQVWPHVVAFAELPPPTELPFRLGIAYPTRAHIEGHGAGAIRYCEFSTGSFVEPITDWQEPHRLAFTVEAQPPTMHEWSPYDISPRHLTGNLQSERGEFRLIPLGDGRTRLEGRTWYRHALFPQSYWNLWSDPLIHTIHRRVLRHIAARSEAAARAAEDS